MKTSLLVPFLLFVPALSAANPLLIVADEVPAMEFLAGKIKSATGIDSTIVIQAEMPASLAPHPAVIVYIHKSITPAAERAFIDYAEAGGKLILLHHSISSGKRVNKDWFPFLKISLPTGEFSQGGYRWIEGVTLDFVNLAPSEYITTHKVAYDKRIRYQSAELGGGEREYPGFTLEDTEVYLNHVYHAPRTILLGLKYTDPKSGSSYMQDRAGWYMPAGKGWVMYFMAGHTVRDFQHPAYAQILINAVVFQPGRTGSQ